MKEKQLSVLFAVTILLLASNIGLCSFTACPVNRQEFISLNRELLPTSNVWATSEDTGFNPVENLITRGHSQDIPPWCSEPNIGTVSGHYVEVNFTEPVVITLLKSSGYYNGFVNNFTIEYGSLEGELQSYSVNQKPQDFLVESVLLDDARFTLEQPIVTLRLRFRVNDALLNDGRICWALVLYGCKLSDGIVINPVQSQQPVTTPSTDSTTPSSTSVPATSTGCPSLPVVTDGATDSTRSNNNEEMLIIVLPVAIATIVIVLVITMVGVIVCINCSGKTKKTKDSNFESVTVHMLNGRTKELTGMTQLGSETPKSAMSFHYDSPRILSYDVPRMSTRSRPASEGGSSDMLSGTFEIKNPLYSLKRRCSKQEPPGVVVPAEEGNDYEMIPDAVTPDTAHSTRHTSLPPYSSDKERSPDPPPSLPLRTHTYSLVKKRGKNTCIGETSIHGSTQDMIGQRGSKERVNESIYNKLSKVAGSDPMFQVVYDEPCKEDSDIDCSVV